MHIILPSSLHDDILYVFSLCCSIWCFDCDLCIFCFFIQQNKFIIVEPVFVECVDAFLDPKAVETFFYIEHLYITCIFTSVFHRVYDGIDHKQIVSDSPAFSPANIAVRQVFINIFIFIIENESIEDVSEHADSKYASVDVDRTSLQDSAR